MELLIGYIFFVIGAIMDENIGGKELKFQFSGRIVAANFPEEGEKTLSPEKMLWLADRWHRHDFREVMAVVSGSCVFKLKNRFYHLNTGDILLLNSMEAHTDGHYPEAGSVYWWGSFWTDMLRIYLWQEDKITDSRVLALGSFSDFIYHLWDEAAAVDGVDARSEFGSVISVLINNFLRNRNSENNFMARNSQSRIMDKIIDYINKMPSLNCTLDSLALLAGYSKVHFQRRFTEYTGMVFREYLLRKRVERYFRIMEKKEASLKEMADELGFASVAALLHWKQRNKERFHL